MPEQFTDFEAARMRDNGTPRAFHSRCEALLPCIKIGDNKLAQWNFLNKLTDSDSRKETMKMWVSDRLLKDILAMIEKLRSSSRGKRRHKPVLEVNEEEDKVLEDREAVNAVHNGSSRPILHARGRGGCGGNYKKGRGSHSSSLCFPHPKCGNEAYNCHGNGCPLAGNDKVRSQWGNGHLCQCRSQDCQTWP